MGIGRTAEAELLTAVIAREDRGIPMKAISSFIALSVVICGCAHQQADKASSGAASDESIQAIRKRAAFDLDCPADELAISVVEKGNFMRPWTFGAAGCDRSKTYLYRAGTIVAN